MTSVNEDPETLFDLGMRAADAGDYANAVRSLAQAAESGMTLAEAQLGIWQLLGTGMSRDLREGFERIRRAAEAGSDIAALLLAGLYAMGIVTPLNWPAATNWLVEAARLGNARALTQLSLLLPDEFPDRMRFARLAAAQAYGPAVHVLDYIGETAVAHARGSGFERVEEELNLPLRSKAPNPTVVREAPRIMIARKFLPTSWCIFIQALAEPALRPATVLNPESGHVRLQERTSSDMAFGVADTDPLIAVVSHRIAHWTGTDVSCGEAATILRYQHGEEYTRHVDFFDPAVPAFADEIARAGQRTVTVLIWLNRDYAAGETEFPLLDWKFKGKVGDGLAFWNVGPNGMPERATVHAGLTPRTGEKWILSKWIRDRRQEL